MQDISPFEFDNRLRFVICYRNLLLSFPQPYCPSLCYLYDSIEIKSVDKPCRLMVASCLSIGILFGSSLTQPVSSHAMEDTPVLLRVSVNPRWDLYARVSRIEETMFTKEDAKDMQKKTEEMQKKTEKKMEETQKKMEKKTEETKKEMMGFTLFTTLLTQLVPIKRFFDETMTNGNDSTVK